MDLLTTILPAVLAGIAAAAALSILFEARYQTLLAARWRMERDSAYMQHCRHCGHYLGASERVPVISYLRLKGKCRHCGGRIAWVYAAIPATALVFAVVAIMSWIQADPLGFLIVMVVAIPVLEVVARSALVREIERVWLWEVAWPERTEEQEDWSARRARALVWRAGASFWLEYRVPGQRVKRWGPYPARAEAIAVMREQVLPRPLRRIYRAMCAEDMLGEYARHGLRESFVQPQPSSFLPAFQIFADSSASSLDALPQAVKESLACMRNTTQAVLAESAATQTR